MRLQPHDGPAEQRLSSSMLRVVDDLEQIDHLRRVLSGFSHRCRNSLNGIKLSLYLCNRAGEGPLPKSWNDLERTYLEVEQFFDRLQAIYRPMSVTMVRTRFGCLVANRLSSWHSWLDSSARSLEVEPPGEDVPGDFDPMLMERGLDALVAWRAEACCAAGDPRLNWRTAEGFFEVSWMEDATSKLSSTNREPTHPGLATRPHRSVDSLALPLLARIISAHGGHLEFSSDPTLSITLRWPQYHVPWDED